MTSPPSPPGQHEGSSDGLGATGSLLPVRGTEEPQADNPSVTAYLGLGSNFGSRRANLTTALHRLRAEPGIEVTAVSPLYETAPVGGPTGQRDYLNAAARIETTLTPEALLAATQRIEHDMGRRRSCVNGPRNIDIDILLYADLCHNSPNLTLPHPRMHQRSFVLRPLTDIARDLRHPGLNRSPAELLAEQATSPDINRIDESKWWGSATA